jgi:hypothetical protein
LPKHSEKVLFAEDCIQYITGYRSIAQTVLVAIQVARLEIKNQMALQKNCIQYVTGYRSIAQTALVAI